MANELAVMGEDTGVSLWRKPETVLAEAKEAAQALVKIVNMKPKKVIFNGETYLEFEDWQTVSKFYGCTTKIISTNLVEYDGVRGFEATAVVLDRHQNEIGRVDSMCLSDEANWGDVPVYEWKDVLDDKGQKIWVEGKDGKKRPKATKVEVRREPKPLFQLRSMAQTRAQVKALRSIFSWVVVMAGYQPTPAEELTGNEFPPEDDDPPKTPVSMPQATTNGLVEVKGKIGSRAVAKDGTIWLHVGESLVALPKEKEFVSQHPFTVGHAVVLDAIKKQGKETSFWVAQSLKSYTAEEPSKSEGEVLPPEKTEEPKKQDEMDKAIASGQLSYDATEPPLGTLEETRTGKVGSKRQTRLWTLMNVNKGKTGLDEKIVHKILDAMEPPVAHLAELEMGFYKHFEQIMTGEVDWKQFVGD